MRDQAIAVVIALYNGGEFIADALDSVAAQTSQPASVIVVDDGSSDNGPAIVEGIARTRDITLVRKEHGGQSSARNVGISHATTPLIALLDQDDIWYPHHLEQLAVPFRDDRIPKPGWAYSNLDQIDREGRMLATNVLDNFVDVEHPKRTLSGCLKTDMYILPSASLINHAAFEDVGGFDENLIGYEDDDLFLRMHMRHYENVYIDSATSKWRVYPNSASHSIQMAQSRMVFFRKWLAILGNQAGVEKQYINTCLAPRLFRVALSNYHHALRKGDRCAQAIAVETMKLLLPFVPERIAVPARLILPLSSILGTAPIARIAARTAPLARFAYNLIAR